MGWGGCGGVGGREENWFDLANLHFMFFDRYEIHIQASGDLFTAKLMSFRSSSSTFHDFRELSFYKIEKTKLDQNKEK